MADEKQGKGLSSDELRAAKAAGMTAAEYAEFQKLRPDLDAIAPKSNGGEEES